jgi:predicted CXXCH cytochrome family protein
MQHVLNDSRYLHGPVRTGNCSACHYTHASRFTTLLRQSFPAEFYQEFELANYALCFGCHSNGIVVTGKDVHLTDFRNGSVNLHYVHVHREEKGRTCRTCHDLHGSNLPRHIAADVPFEGGSWAMPIKFQRTDNGGRCSPACHETMEYTRQPAPPGGAAAHVELAPRDLG